MARSSNKAEKYNTSSGACDVVCLRGFLIGFNFIFIVGGAGVFAVGIWTLMAKMQYVALLGTVYYNLIVYLLIGAGITVFITGIIGCVGALRRNTTLLMVYFILLMIIFLAELIAGILGFVYHSAIHNELSADLKLNINKNYDQAGHEALTKAVDEMQQEFDCCGVDNFRDWQNSTFINNNKDLKTPLSCCKTPGPSCSKSDHPSNIYRILGNKLLGCLSQLEGYLKKNLFLLAVTGVTVGCLEILVMIFACCLYCAIRKEDEDEDSY